MVESARPGRGRTRATNRAENGSVGDMASVSGTWPFTLSCRRERNLVSRKNSPSAVPGVISPLAEEMAKAEPSTKVTVVPELPTATASPAKVHGSDTAVRLQGQTVGPDDRGRASGRLELFPLRR